MISTNTPGFDGVIKVPGLDSEVSKAFSLQELQIALWGGNTEAKLQALSRNVNGTRVYPTAVYMGNQIVNLLGDMTLSIRSDDPTRLPRSREFFNGPKLVLEVNKITGVAAYKTLPESSPRVSAGVQDSVQGLVSA